MSPTIDQTARPMDTVPTLPLSPAFCGALLPPGVSGTPANIVGKPIADPRTCLPCRQIQSDSLSLSTTGSVATLESGGTVVVIGEPRCSGAPGDSSAREGAQLLADLYQERGIDCVGLLHGAFAFAIYDAGSQKLYAGLDRFGQYQLYYAITDGMLVFGTAALAVMNVSGANAELQPQGIYNYVYFHMVPSPTTTYTGLNKLASAHYLSFGASGIELTNYWKPRFRESATDLGKDSGRQLKEHLEAAVRRATPAAARVGSFLSGGLDSSTVSGILAEQSSGQAEAYAIGFEAEGYDEMAYARITANHFGMKLNELYVTPEDVVEALPLIATSYDEPFGNSSALPAWFCAQEAKKSGVSVLLAGDGGDEFFAGNERYASQDVFENYLKIPSIVRRGLIEPVVATLPEALPLIRKGRSFLAQANTPLPERLQTYNFLHRHDPAEVFTRDFLAGVDTGLPLDLQREVYHRPDDANRLNRMMYSDWQFTLADNDLRKVSHMAAISGIDVRYPMLDDELVEFSCRIPSDMKLRPGDLRHFFKESLRGWLPDETISKKKHGFGLPFGVWMKTHEPLRELAYDNILALKKRPILDPRFLDSLIDMHQTGHAAYYGELIWILTVLELWLAARS